MRMDKISISYSADKLQAIRVLRPEIYQDIEKSLEDCMDKIYIKSVPLTTRQYIEARIQDEEPKKQPKQE